MKRRPRVLPLVFAGVAGLAGTGCSKKPTYVQVDLPYGVSASAVEGSVSGRALAFHEGSGGTPADGIAFWTKDESAPPLLLDISLRTPCGKKKLPHSRA